MIRLATEYDLDGIVDVIEQCALAQFGTKLADRTYWLNDIKFHLAFNESFIIVNELDGDLIGFFVGRLTYEPMLQANVCIEHHWFVKPTHRGTGTLLRREAECVARSRGAAKLLIHCPDERIKCTLAKDNYTEMYAIYGKVL